MIQNAKLEDIDKIKFFVDSFSKELDLDKDTFSKKYYRRILKEGIILIARNNNKIVGVCFGKYNQDENWADLLLIIVDINYRKSGIGKQLILEFENLVKSKNISSIDFYGDEESLNFFKKMGYEEGRRYISFRKSI